MPEPEAWGFEGQFRFSVAIGHFNLPTTGIGQNELPGVVGGKDGFIGEQIPGLATWSLARNYQPQIFIWEVRVSDFQGQKANLALDMAAGVINGAMLPGALATCNFPGIDGLALSIQELIGFGPAQDEARDCTEYCVNGSDENTTIKINNQLIQDFRPMR